jgi:hypothetical protein
MNKQPLDKLRRKDFLRGAENHRVSVRLGNYSASHFESSANSTSLQLDSSVQRVEALKAIQPDKFELWKYYEDRADHLGERMWTIGLWLMTVVTATLSLPFVAKLVAPISSFPYLKSKNCIAVSLVAIFGGLLCVYSYASIHDLKEHIESNWRRAGSVLDGSWQSTWSGRKEHGWKVLLSVGTLAAAGFLGLLLLAIFQRAG